MGVALSQLRFHGLSRAPFEVDDRVDLLGQLAEFFLNVLNLGRSRFLTELEEHDMTELADIIAGGKSIRESHKEGGNKEREKREFVHRSEILPRSFRLHRKSQNFLDALTLRFRILGQLALPHMNDPATSWNRYQKYLVRYDEDRLKFSLDISRMEFEDDWLDSMEERCQEAFGHLTALESGELVNEDEGRMVGHYWLRNSIFAPTPELRAKIDSDIEAAKAFAQSIHRGEIRAEKGGVFKHLLLVGIGGSALGPQLVEDALSNHRAPLTTWFLDNTDPEGIDRVLAEIGEEGLQETLTVVTSKSGGTPETYNGMKEVERAYVDAGLSFAKHAVAITGPGSKLDQLASEPKWIRRFAMDDWVGGRTSVMSVVGLVPAALQKVDIDSFLAGAAAMDARTRMPKTRENAAMLMALMWFAAGNGKGEKDMVVLPYKDRLVLFSKYLQQLVMESLGKEYERGNSVRVEQGIAVYGNKGSTDQHAYVQQLRDGVNNFFAVFIEVLKERDGDRFVTDNTTGASAGDFLQGFLRGTRDALSEKGRESMTISVPQVDAFNLGVLIALFERAVTFYADLVNINAYHQPGVEAGKKAAGSFLSLMSQVRSYLESNLGKELTASQVAEAVEGAPESVYHILTHLSATSPVTRTFGKSPGEDVFVLDRTEDEDGD